MRCIVCGKPGAEDIRMVNIFGEETGTVKGPACPGKCGGLICIPMADTPDKKSLHAWNCRRLQAAAMGFEFTEEFPKSIAEIELEKALVLKGIQF